MKKAWNDVQSIFTEASPNAIHEIDSPLPRPIGYLVPLSGSGYATSMSVFRLLLLRVLKIGDFP